MNEEENSRTKSGFWLGVILGGLVGAVAAYLAVDDKSELRKSLLKKGKILLDHLEDFKDEAVEKGEEVKKDVTEKISDVKEEIRDKVEEIPEVAQEAVENVQEVANQAISQIVKAADKTEANAHKKARLFFLKKGKPLVKK